MTESTSPSLQALLTLALDAVIQRASTDPAYAARLREAALFLLDSLRENETATPQLNPLAILRSDGEDALRQRLEHAEPDELKSVVTFHDLDPTEAAQDLRAEALREFILQRCLERNARDTAFSWKTFK